MPNAAIMVAEQAGALIGFVTIDASGYLDQLVVAPDHWGSELANALVDEAKRLSPDRITLLVNTDNSRAIRFYERNGFVQAGERCQSDVGPAGAADGMEGVSSFFPSPLVGEGGAKLPDEGSASAERTPRPSSLLREATLSHKGRGEVRYTPSNCNRASRA